MNEAGLPTVETIRERALEVGQRIEAVADGRNVTMVAVTKAHPVELAVRAVSAGLVDLGENYAQELAAKAPVLAGGGEHRWHFIGGLQRNKVKLLAGSVALWQTVDREALAVEIAKRAPGAAVLVQVNTTGEQQKSGCEPRHAPHLVGAARAVGLDVRGLMTVGPTDPSLDPRPCFAALRTLAERLELPELSMGMSADFELAVAEGATIVRVGSVLFGARPGPTMPRS